MSRLTRLAAGLLLSAAFAAPGRAAEIDPVLPAECESVFAVNMRQIVDANLVKKFVLGQLKQMMQGSDVAKELSDLGLDPLKDIDRVVGGSWGQGDDGNLVMVIRGKFDLEKLFAAAEAKAKTDGDKFKIVSEGGSKLVQVVIEQLPKPLFLTGADEKTLVGAFSAKQATTAADVARKGGTARLKGDLATLVLKQDEKASLFLCGLAPKEFAGLPPGVGGGLVDTAKIGEQLKGLKSYGMTLRLTDDIALEFEAGMADTEAAEAFGASLSQLVGTAKTFLPAIAGMQPSMKAVADEVANTLKSTVKEKDVTLSLKLSGDAIGKAAGGGD
jgi:hypothetical protein